MVKFTDGEFEKHDKLFVKEDPARMTRGLKDLLVGELNADRIEASKNKFDVSAPKDDIEIHAINEKSPHTLIHYTIDLEASSAGGLEAIEREDVMQADINCSCEVLTFYPGAEKREWLPAPVTADEPVDRKSTRLNSSHRSLARMPSSA